MLSRCAATIRQAIREIDTFGRYGGEEFLLIMPDTPRSAAYAVAERLRVAVQDLTFDAQGANFGVTLSLGVAESKTGESYPALLQRADAALYLAKNSGRNRVCRDDTSARSAIQTARHAHPHHV